MKTPHWEVREAARAYPIEAPTHYAGLLGLGTRATLKLVDRVSEGLPYSAFAEFQSQTGLAASALADLSRIPVRTLHRRRAEGRFSSEESDRLLRAARVVHLALGLFEGNMGAARRWLLDTQPGLGGAIPLEFAATDIGAREIEQLIGRLEHGVVS
jgi:putative toxin-antitoxin system antitoxin component (TIGR02293 family)